MTLRGIDAQLMITRAADYTKDASAMQRKNELMQDYMAVQQKAAEAQDKQKVLKSLEPEEVRLNPDDDGNGGGAAGERRSGAKKRGAQSDDETAKPGAVVMSEERLIDIKI